VAWSSARTHRHENGLKAVCRFYLPVSTLCNWIIEKNASFANYSLILCTVSAMFMTLVALF